MKRIIIFAIVILAALTTTIDARAQANESIWLTASTTAYKTGETVLVALNASSATPIQGFTFQIRYDPACLQPVNASSQIPGMNPLPLPQLSGLVDGSYASTTPQTANGILAEVRFTALKGCQTGLTLESAALAIRNTEGFAAPLAGVALGESNLSLNIDSAVAAPQPEVESSGAVLPLAPAKPDQQIPLLLIFGILFAVLAACLMFGPFLLFRKRTPPKAKTPRPSSATRQATLHIKHGPQAGRSISLNKLPIVIGRDPQNDIYINDPHLSSHHAQIYSSNNRYYIRDLGGGTVVNGHPVRSSTAALHRGDVVRLGRSVLFVFG